MKPFIYLACPYAHDDESIRNYRAEEATRCAAKLMEAGYPTFNPVGHGHPINLVAGHQIPHEQWMRLDMLILAAAEMLVILGLPGWDTSKGVKLETDWWNETKRPWFFTPYSDIDLYRLEAAWLGSSTQRS